MLVIENVSKTYKHNFKALNEVSLTIGTGMFGLLGPNGAGKSTLMRTIATLQTADSGSITFDSIDVKKNEMELRKVLGYLPQDFGVFPKTSAYDLLNYFALLKGISIKKERQEMIDFVLNMTNLTEAQYKNVSDFSGGMKQRFGIAQLLLNKPKLIIVDEPTAGLDPEERHRFLNILKSLSKESTVIFSTHIVEDVNDLCSHFAIMNRGEIKYRNTPLQAVSEFENKIWTKEINENVIDEYQQNYNLLSSSFNNNQTILIRVLSNIQIKDKFTQVKPKLEDVYFSVLNETEVSI